jgi:MFS transporter, DHA1 family, inner membrane transport protein
MAGNFAIGCGVMVIAGSLNDLSHALAVSPAVAGQLITAGAVAMGLGAPLLAAVLGGLDRRRLLSFALLWYAVGHTLCALMPNLATLLPVRVLTMLGAALFTPQAAAAINVLAPPDQRGRAITVVFMGWSISSVIGMPMNGFIAETQGWRWAFAMVAGLSAVAAIAVWRTVPDDVRSPALSLKSWGDVLSNPLLMGMVAVTALSSAGQFTLFSYLAPYYRQVLGASAAGVTFLFFWFGAFGLIGNVLMTRSIDKLGAARGVNIAILLMLLSLLLWPLSAWVGKSVGASGWALVVMALISTPWALGLFASNSGQQARLSQSAPAVAPALLALNTSAIYVGQAAGAGGGGALLANFGFAPLSWVGLAWMVLALGVSAWAASKMKSGGQRVAHA